MVSTSCFTLWLSLPHHTRYPYQVIFILINILIIIMLEFYFCILLIQSSGISRDFSTVLILNAWKGKFFLIQTINQGFKHPPLIMGSILGTFLSVIFWLAGYKYTLAGRAAIYNQLSTIFIIIMAAIFLKEAMTRRKWLAITCALSGALLVSAY